MSSIRGLRCSQLSRSSVTSPLCRQLHQNACLKAEDGSNAKTAGTGPSKTEPASTASRQRKSSLALRQVENLRSRRQGIVGITGGGFAPATPTANNTGISRAKDGSSRRSSNPQSSILGPPRIRRAADTGSSTVGKDAGLSGNFGNRATPLPPRSRSARPIERGTRQPRRTDGRGKRKEAPKASSDDSPITDEEERALEKLFWMRQEQGEAAARKDPNFNPGVLENAQSLAITSPALARNHTSSMAGLSGPASQITATLGRLAERADDSWAIDANLARRLLKGKLMRFSCAEERRRVFELANQHVVRNTAFTAVKKEQPFEMKPLEWKPLPREYRDKIVGRLLKGNYKMHDVQKDKTATTTAFRRIEMALNRQETMTPFASQMFLKTFKKLYPAASPRAQAP